MNYEQESTRWLDRGLLYGIHYALFTDKESFYAACANMGKEREEIGRWLGDSGKTTGACTHFLRETSTKELYALICIQPSEEGIVSAGTLVHEAVHVFQECMAEIGERKPSDELMAYSIQWISQQLMWEFTRQTLGAQHA